MIGAREEPRCSDIEGVRVAETAIKCKKNRPIIFPLVTILVVRLFEGPSKSHSKKMSRYFKSTPLFCRLLLGRLCYSKIAKQ